MGLRFINIFRSLGISYPYHSFAQILQWLAYSIILKVSQKVFQNNFRCLQLRSDQNGNTISITLHFIGDNDDGHRSNI